VTVTDAHVWLGRLPVDAFLGGERTLDREAIRRPLATIADALGSSLEGAAEGILAVADTAMEGALRVISVERGYDPIDFAVVGFGGAGALHVAELARRLGASRAIVPPDPGLLSAYGMLASPLTKEVSRTVLARADDPGTPARIRTALAALESEATEAMLAEGANADALEAERRIDARYVGQSFELGVEASDWVEAFHQAHLERYGYERRLVPVEAVTLRVTVTAPAATIVQPELPAAVSPPPTRPLDVVFGGASHRAALIRREDLRAGHHVGGPAVIEEYSGTTWVPLGCRVSVDAWGCLHMTFEA
jgi:N-methylhydantoinase A